MPDIILNPLVSNCAVELDLLERMSGLTFVLTRVGGVGLSRLINSNRRGGCRDNTRGMLSSSIMRLVSNISFNEEPRVITDFFLKIIQLSRLYNIYMYVVKLAFS